MRPVGVIWRLPVFHGPDGDAHDGLEPIPLDNLVATDGGRGEIWMVFYVFVDTLGECDFAGRFHFGHHVGNIFGRFFPYTGTRIAPVQWKEKEE